MTSFIVLFKPFDYSKSSIYNKVKLKFILYTILEIRLVLRRASRFFSYLKRDKFMKRNPLNPELSRKGLKLISAALSNSKKDLNNVF